MTRLRSSTLLRQVTLGAIALFLGAATLNAQNERVIHTFTGGSDGNAPFSSLISDAHGNLYGTSSGAPSGGGTVFELSRPAGVWTETVLHSFSGGTADGFQPYASLISDNAGNLYGTTQTGGTSDLGTVFRLKPPSVPAGSWTETILYSFLASDGTNNGNRGGGLLLKGNVLYGTTAYGGANGAGTVYALAENASGVWNLKLLYTFLGGTDGFGPEFSCDALVSDKSGNLYGTTSFGGMFAWGTVFEMTPPTVAAGPWTETVLYSFGAIGDLQTPVTGLIFDASGNLYGTANGGGPSAAGGVYELTPPSTVGGSWTESVLYNFAGGDDGSVPNGNLIFDKFGNLYGNTFSGGVNLDGTVYKLTPPSVSGGAWTKTILHNFPSSYPSDGFSPASGLLIGPGGNLYGATYLGGRKGEGTIYELHQ